MDTTSLDPIVADKSEFGPMKNMLRSTSQEIKLLSNRQNKHWICKGKRSIAIASSFLLQNEIVAIPTDTVYGFAGIASNTESIQKLYKIKERDEKKPLCISVASVSDIKNWGVTDHLPPSLLSEILPGPYTIILKRTPALNHSLNPGIDTVGIRVPKFKFINDVSKLVGPLALTSANLSNEPSCLKATEFEGLWPQLGAIFYSPEKIKNCRQETLRKGSTIIDLSCPEQCKIVRYGVSAGHVIHLLKQKYGYTLQF